MLIKEFLENVCNQIRYKPMREDISEELGLHIQEMKEEHMSYGLSEKEAEERAVANMGDSIEIGKKLDKIHRPKFDWILFLLVGILIGFGFLITIIKIQINAEDFYFVRHITFLILGLIISAGIYFLDYRKVLGYHKILYSISSSILIFTILFGRAFVGRKYIWISGNRFDPTNMCILLYIISFVGFIKNLNNKNTNVSIGKINLKIRLDILELVVLSIISILLIMNGNRVAISSVLFLSYIIITTSHIAKLPNRKSNLIKFYGTFLVAGLMFIIVIGLIDSSAYSIILKRIVGTYNDEVDYGTSWVNTIINNVLEHSNMFSGLEDVGYFSGLFDGGAEFALITIIAYCGTVYSAIIILAVSLLAVKIIYDCRNIKDEEGRLLIIGFGSFILIQAIFNILMNFNLIPIVALNLPFISYGLNGLLVNMMSIAFILSIYRRKDILTKNEKAKKLKFKISYE